MKAIVQQRYGESSLRVCDVPEPVAREGEALVRVRAASLHPDVWHAVAGRPWVLRFMGSGVLGPRQAIPGTDMAGVVERAGPGVTGVAAGDEVFGETNAENQWANGGAFAELVAVPTENLARKPPNVSFEQAASVPCAGLIALQNLPEPDRLPAGSEALVNGAGGGVGSLALQILKSYGARVTAVDSTGKLELLRSLGADRTIDYTREDVLRREERYDYVFDVPASRPYRAWKRVLTEQGRYVPIGHDAYGRVGGLGRRILGLIPYFLTLMLRSRFDRHLGSGRASLPSKQEVVARLRDLLASGALTPVVDSVYPFSEVREAFRHLMEDELRGKVLLAP